MPVNKVRRKGSYAPLSAHYYKDDAVAEAGEAAELLYVRGLAFCADVLSDGFISDRQLSRFVGVGMRDAAKRAGRLVEVGLWSRESGGWRVAGWLKWNRSRDDITDLNSKDSARKAGGSAGPDDDVPPPGDDDAPSDSDTTPNGIRTESDTGEHGTPNGIQPRAHGRAQTPRHSTPRHSSRSSADADPDEINAGTIVAAWAEAIQANGPGKPNGSMRAQVGREARELLEDGAEPERVLAAAKQVGAKGYATLNREYQGMRGRNVHPIRPSSPYPYDENGQLRDPGTGVLIER